MQGAHRSTYCLYIIFIGERVLVTLNKRRGDVLATYVLPALSKGDAAVNVLCTISAYSIGTIRLCLIVSA